MECGRNQKGYGRTTIAKNSGIKKRQAEEIERNNGGLYGISRSLVCHIRRKKWDNKTDDGHVPCGDLVGNDEMARLHIRIMDTQRLNRGVGRRNRASRIFTKWGEEEL